MADDTSTLSRLKRLVSSAASVVAPLSVVTALLFYFGYASSRAQYDYFGIDVDTIGLSTQDYVMRSPQPLLTPLLALLLLAVVIATLNGAIRRRVATAITGARAADSGTAEWSRRRLARGRRIASVIVVVGWVVLVAGVILLLAYGQFATWWLYPLVTPLLMALGSAFALYGHWLSRLHDSQERLRPPAVVSMVLLLATSVFWTTATLAEWSGRGLALEAARNLDRLPGVILDTQERLHLTSPNVSETILEASPDQSFHYRYGNLRLLIEGQDRLFLVPGGRWSVDNSTLVVPMDSGAVRLQFQFRNQSPYPD